MKYFKADLIINKELPSFEKIVSSYICDKISRKYYHISCNIFRMKSRAFGLV